MFSVGCKDKDKDEVQKEPISISGKCTNKLARFVCLSAVLLVANIQFLCALRNIEDKLLQ